MNPFKNQLASILIVSVIFLIGTGSMHVGIAANHQLATPDGSTGEFRIAVNPSDQQPGSYFSDIEVSAGEDVELSVTVLNDSTFPVHLRVYPASVSSNVNGGFVAGSKDDELVGAARWIDFPEFQSEFASRSEQIVNFGIHVPKDTEPGQYIASIVVETVDAVKESEDSLMSHRFRYAMAISILVPGDLSYGFDLDVPVFEDGSIKIPITNTGNYLVRPEGVLTLSDDSGNMVVSADLELGSIYSHTSTYIEIRLPDQITPGDYLLLTELTDPNSGATASLDEAPINIPEPADPTGLFLANYEILPNSEDLAFANVNVEINNGGGHIQSVSIVLVVYHDGNIVDEFPLATNQHLVSGETQFVGRYIPLDDWQSGTYSFHIIVHAVNPQGGQQIELLNEELDAEIVVP